MNKLLSSYKVPISNTSGPGGALNPFYIIVINGLSVIANMEDEFGQLIVYDIDFDDIQTPLTAEVINCCSIIDTKALQKN